MATGSQIRKYRTKAGLTLEQLSELSGVEVGTISAIEQRDSSRSSKFSLLAAALGMTVEMLERQDTEYDVIELMKDRAAGAPSVAGQPGAVEVRDRGTPYLPGFEALSIPMLANSGSMGAGEDQMHDEVVVGRLTVSPQWAQRTIKPLTKLENLRFIHGWGDSMDPTFADGDILLVDIGIQTPKIDGIYVLEANDRIYIKRVRQRMDGQFEVSSDNPTVKTVDVLDGTHPVQVRGRVVWCWNGKKM